MLARAMPTLLKFITFCAVVAGTIFLGMYALATFVEPHPADLSFTVPSDKLRKDDQR